jgi:hypothetical protein
LTCRLASSTVPVEQVVPEVGKQVNKLPVTVYCKAITFALGYRQCAAIEQNPDKPSPWGALARSGRQVVRFRDVETNRFVAVAVDGEAKEYGGGKRWRHPQK